MHHVSSQDWSLDELLMQGARFHPVTRISCMSKDLERQTKQHEDKGVPIVVEGWHKHVLWSQEIFNMEFCLQYFKGKDINVRNVHNRLDSPMPFTDFVEKSRTSLTIAEAEETERWYGKDVECPKPWEDWLVKERVLPERYLPEGSNDLFSLRPKKNGRSDVETLMCYFGIGDTYTPCHKDLCASSGQNLMCYAEKGGSSFWFMTKAEDCIKVSQYFQSMGHELDLETHIVSVSDLAKAPFDVFITEQKLGDLVLIPPRSCHQVVNYGGMSIKLSWSRMTLAGLSTALYHELPMYRRVCRSEIYQIKSTVYYTLKEYTKRLNAFTEKAVDIIPQNVIQQLKTVLHLYDHILRQEYSPDGTPFTESSEESTLSGLAEDYYACDFCGADIFQSYFQCSGGSRAKAGEKEFIICSGCYVEGRTCACQAMEQKQRQSPDVLFDARWEALEALTNVKEPIDMFQGTDSLVEQKRTFSKIAAESVFHAAILLHNVRSIEESKSRSCRDIHSKPHSVPATQAISCKRCHSSKCYAHLLSNSCMHSMRALLLLEKDYVTHTVYHDAHRRKWPDYEDRKDHLLASQVEGLAYPDFRVLMVYNALTFTTCQPVKYRHASLGFYDQLLPAGGHKLPEELQTGSMKFKNGLSTMDAGSDIPTTPHSLLSDSQRSVKNHVYVELDHSRPSRHASRKLPVSRSSLSTSSAHYSDNDPLLPYSDHSDCLNENLPSTRRKPASRERGSLFNNQPRFSSMVENFPVPEVAKEAPASHKADHHEDGLSKKRNVRTKVTSTSPDQPREFIVRGSKSGQDKNEPSRYTPQKIASAGGVGVSTSDHLVNSQVGPSIVRGVKKPRFGNSHTIQVGSNKRSQSEAGNDDAVFSPVYPIGPPRKKRRPDGEQGSQITEASKVGTSSGDIAKTKAPNTFAASLGAAINQVAENATRTHHSSRTTDSSAKRRSSGDGTVTAPSPIAVPHGSLKDNALSRGKPILVDVAELQESVVKAADRVVRQLVGDMPPAMLAAHAAVSMMTNYAANGQFINNNTQLQFPSMAQFIETSTQMQAKTVSNKSQRASSSSNPNQSFPPMRASPGVTAQAQTQVTTIITTSDKHDSQSQREHVGKKAERSPRPLQRVKPNPGRPTPSSQPMQRVASGASGTVRRKQVIRNSDSDEEL